MSIQEFSSKSDRPQPSAEGAGELASCEINPRTRSLLRPPVLSKKLRRLADECAEYILQNNGPDSEGGAHPKMKRIPLPVIETALTETKSRGLPPDFEPYHFKIVVGLLADSRQVDAILKKKGDVLLHHQFGGDLFRLCTQVELADFQKKFVDRPADRAVEVSVLSLTHTTFKGKVFDLLQRYLQISGQEAAAVELRPFHLAHSTRGTWADQKIRDTALQEICSQLIARKFNGDITRFCTEVSWEDFREPFRSPLAGKEVAVSTSRLIRTFPGGCFEMVRRYLELSGTAELLRDIRPYFMATCGPGTWENTQNVDEVLKAKVGQVLEKTYGKDLTRLCREATLTDFEPPCAFKFGRGQVNVSTAGFINACDFSPQKILRRYLELTGHADLADELQPYRRARAGQGTSRAGSDQLLTKKIDQVLAESLNGDLVRLCTEGTREMLETPLRDSFGGEEIFVSMGKLTMIFRSSPFRMIRRYLEITGEDRLAEDFRPYHLAQSAKGIWQDERYIDEVVLKKSRQLLNGRFGGDLFRFCTEVSMRDYSEPLIDVLGEREMAVSMLGFINHFDGSPYRILKRFLELSGQSAMRDELRPYHMTMSPLRTWLDDDLVNEVIVKKIDQLLSTTFHGDLHALCAEANAKILFGPLVETLAGREISLSLGPVASTAFQNSPFAMLQRYFNVKGREFPYTRECFVGPPECRVRRMSGEFSHYDLGMLRLPDGSFDASLFGLRRFSSQDKVAVREFMVELTALELQDLGIRYLGLETERFESVRRLADYVNLEPESSVIVESDSRVVNAMNSARGMWKSDEGKMLRSLTIIPGKIERELETLAAPEQGFNVVNLDWLGHLSASKEYALQLLFDRDLLAERALIFVTLQDSALARARARQGAYIDGDQTSNLTRITERYAKLTGRRCTLLGSLEYKGGTGSGNGSRMAFAAIRLERVEPDAVTMPNED